MLQPFSMMRPYAGRPYADARWPGGPQSVPGRVYCAYYDVGGEGVAYHDTTEGNQGSGKLNPKDGTYLNEFRIGESVDTSYTKPGGIDDGPFNRVLPDMGMPYVGWTTPGEWTNYTIEVKQTGVYSVGMLYTSNMGGAISLDVDGLDMTGPIHIESTYDASDDLAWRQWHHWNIHREMADIPLEKGAHVLTLHTVENGQMNYLYLEFAIKE